MNLLSFDDESRKAGGVPVDKEPFITLINYLIHVVNRHP
jgi:hypothetical protein